MQDTILIAHISDLHLVPYGRRCYGVVDTNALAVRAIDAVNRLRTRPAAVIVSGDVIETAREEDYAVARDILGKLEVPVHVVCGNHDNSTGMNRAFAGLREGPPAIPDRVCYATDIDLIRLIVLDSSIPGVGHGEISPEQLDFLASELSASADQPTLISVHHPPIRTGHTAMDGFGLTNSAALAGIVERHANVLAILCGHVHRSILGVFAGAPVAIAPATGHQIELSVDDDVFAFNLEPPGFFLHRWTPDSGMTTQLAMVDRYPGPYQFPWKKAD